jgi:8-amino-7-oxononanoate synthase
MLSGFSEPLQQVERVFVRWRGRQLIYFGGCDYLRLSSHPAMIRALASAAKQYGLSVAASRRTTGNHVLYEQLEEAARKFFGAESAVLVSNGYLTNLAVAQGLRGTIDHVLIDERAHFSLQDAAAILGCPRTKFAHCDANDLCNKARKYSARKKIAVLTDGMFANDGSIVHLELYRDALGPNASIWVDDAHAAGILGERGAGSVEFARINRRNVIQTITFSKAFGAYGGAILCDEKRAQRIVTQSSVLTGNTPLPLPLAAAALTALEICWKKPLRREKLWRNVATFWKELGRVPKEFSPIISVAVRNPAVLKRRLLQAGIYPPFIEYGGGPVSQFFRFAISSEHTAEQIKGLARTLAASRKNAKRNDDLLFLGFDV